MAARNKPAGIRALVYGIGKGKADIEGLSVSAQVWKSRLSYSNKLWIVCDIADPSWVVGDAW